MSLHRSPECVDLTCSGLSDMGLSGRVELQQWDPDSLVGLSSCLVSGGLLAILVAFVGWLQTSITSLA
jgi:hypothetical protein